MKEHILELSGYVHLDGDDEYTEPYLEPKLVKPVGDYDYYYPSVKSVGELVSDHFKQLVKPLKVTLEDWQRADYVTYKSVFVQYYVAPHAITWGEANEASIRKQAGDLEVENRYEGYSEWTVTDSWTDLFVGGHDLRKELISLAGKFVIIRIHYKA